MHGVFNQLNKALTGLLLNGLFLIGAPAWAQPVWHCSRSDVQIANASDDFTLAALTIEREVIRLSLGDLYDVYQGNFVKLSGGLTLSACVVGGSSNLTAAAAMRSIGNKRVLTTAPNSGLTSNLHIVEDESEMLRCIAKHHPAIGYLSKLTHTEAVGPCF
jgi:hypothetical protein